MRKIGSQALTLRLLPSGRVDLARAAGQQVYAVQPTRTLGPLTVGDAPASGTITYRNDGAR